MMCESTELSEQKILESILNDEHEQGYNDSRNFLLSIVDLVHYNVYPPVNLLAEASPEYMDGWLYGVRDYIYEFEDNHELSVNYYTDALSGYMDVVEAIQQTYIPEITRDEPTEAYLYGFTDALWYFWIEESPLYQQLHPTHLVITLDMVETMSNDYDDDDNMGNHIFQTLLQDMYDNVEWEEPPAQQHNNYNLWNIPVSPLSVIDYNYYYN